MCTNYCWQRSVLEKMTQTCTLDLPKRNPIPSACSSFYASPFSSLLSSPSLVASAPALHLGLAALQAAYRLRWPGLHAAVHAEAAGVHPPLAAWNESRLAERQPRYRHTGRMQVLAFALRASVSLCAAVRLRGDVRCAWWGDTRCSPLSMLLGSCACLASGTA